MATAHTAGMLAQTGDVIHTLIHPIIDVAAVLYGRMPDDEARANAARLADSWNCCEIMERRGWWAVPGVLGWRVRTEHGQDMPLDFLTLPHRGTFPAPAAAMIAADEWMRAREQAGTD